MQKFYVLCRFLQRAKNWHNENTFVGYTLIRDFVSFFFFFFTSSFYCRSGYASEDPRCVRVYYVLTYTYLYMQFRRRNRRIVGKRNTLH